MSYPLADALYFPAGPQPAVGHRPGPSRDLGGTVAGHAAGMQLNVPLTSAETRELPHWTDLLIRSGHNHRVRASADGTDQHFRQLLLDTEDRAAALWTEEAEQ